MITRDDLKQRQYDGPYCVSFFMVFTDDDIKMRTSCLFERSTSDLTTWEMTAAVDDGSGKKQFYNFEYELPTSSVRLELIAAAGLLRLRQILEVEVQAKQVLDVYLADATRGM